MKFWYIKAYNYQSDYDHLFVNGQLDHPFGLPGVDCEICGETWGKSRVLEHKCPDSMRLHKNVKERWPISRLEHETLQEKLMSALRISGTPFVDMRPGDELQPGFLDVPSRPEADFLWPSLGTLVVSDRIKNLLQKACTDEIAVFPLELRRIGDRPPILPAPIPQTGEPEDIIEESTLLQETKGIGPYYEIIVQEDSALPRGVVLEGICDGCKRVITNNSHRELRMFHDMWNGNQIFMLATTFKVVITDVLKQCIESLRPSNVFFELA